MTMTCFYAKKYHEKRGGNVVKRAAKSVMLCRRKYTIHSYKTPYVCVAYNLI